MFGLFKRTKIETWEIILLKNVIKKLSTDYFTLEKQIDDGLLRGVLIGLSDIPGYVGFTYNSKIYKRFEHKKEKPYKITGIKVFDKKSKEKLNYSIYVSAGALAGYSITGAKKFDLDVDSIEIEEIRKEHLYNKDYNKIEPFLSVEERKLLDEMDVYEVILDGLVYYHIRDMEDGDFIGIDYEKNVYKITHDPFQIKKIDRKLIDILRS
jgi:hypothetical protein